MIVIIKQWDLVVLKDKDEFFLLLHSGNIQQNLVYLQKEDIFIHKFTWWFGLKSGSN